MDDLPRDPAGEGAGQGQVLGGVLPVRVIGEYVRAVLGSGRNARLYLYGLFLCGLGQSIFALLFNLYLRELGMADAGIGQILSKISLGATAASYLLLGTLVQPELLLLAAFFSGMVVTTFRLPRSRVRARARHPQTASSRSPGSWPGASAPTSEGP